MFSGIHFVKPNRQLNEKFEYSNLAPMFRAKFNADDTENAKLYVCGLGYGYYYINGKNVSNDLFTAPVSDYTKTLWYNAYDVTNLLKKGENVIAVWCGNGWYNEDIDTPWKFNEAEWRDVPKFMLKLDIGGKTVISSNDRWKCTTDGPIWFNALRSGEYFDARRYDENWTACDYDDSDWEDAVTDFSLDGITKRRCECEPICEFEAYKAKEIIKVSDTRYVYDIGQNISGYVRLGVKGRRGQELTIRYAEVLHADNSRDLDDMLRCYPESEFQTDKFICSGKAFVWSPRFAYHGFRYIDVEGIDSPDEVEVSGVFVHQAVEQSTEFECSNALLNKMFNAGVKSVYSNMFYSLTDCPTREKLGWMNDAQSSAEQILTNFKAEKFLEKWLYDIYDSMKESGEMSCIVPTAGWGYEWGNGPVSDGTLFEIPYKIYMHTKNEEPLKRSLPYFDKYFSYIDSRTDADGFVRFGLYDWAYPGFSEDNDVALTPLELINAVLIRKFYTVAKLAAKLCGADESIYEKRINDLTLLIKDTYISESGECKVNRQTAVALLVYYGIYDDVEPLKQQLKHLVEATDFHHDCGMVGVRRLFIALNKLGLEEYAYKVITAKRYPSFSIWFESGATTLWETWDAPHRGESKNHHMYSDFMSWIVKTILGINSEKPGDDLIVIAPYFFRELGWAKGICNTNTGKVGVEWKREENAVRLSVTVSDGMNVKYKNEILGEGTHTFVCKEE